MTLAVASTVSFANKTSGSSIGITGTAAVDDYCLFMVAGDNNGVGGVAPSVTSVVSPGTNPTPTLLASGVQNPGLTNGVALWIWGFRVTQAFTAQSILANFGNSMAGKTSTLIVISTASGSTVTATPSAVQPGATTGTARTSIPTNADDLFVGVMGAETNITPTITVDSDTAGGNPWVLAEDVATSGGSAVTNIRLHTEYKITTSAAPSQSWLPTFAAVDHCLCLVKISESGGATNFSQTVGPDALGLTDTPLQVSFIDRNTVNEAFGLNDQASALYQASRALTDPLGLADGVSYSQFTAHAQTITDAENLTDPGGGVFTFDPLSIGWHLALWADDPGWTNPGDGNNVASWDNAGSLGGAATEVSGGVGPTFRSAVGALGGRAALEFNGSEWLQYLATFHSQPAEYFIVVNDTLGSGDPTIIDGQGGGRNLIRIDSSMGQQMYAGTSLGGGSRITGAHAVRALFDGASSVMDVDGINRLSGNAGTEGPDNYRIGTDVAGPNYLVGHIAFIGYIDGTLTTQERSDLLAWAQSYYGTPGGGGGGSGVIQVLMAVRSQTDAEGLVDAAAAVSAVARAITDAEGLTDAATAAQGFVSSFTDAEGLTDALTSALTLVRSTTDPEGLLDALNAIAGYSRSATDAEGLTDAATDVSVSSQIITDPVGLADAAASGLVVVQAVTDAEGLTDAATDVQGFVAAVTDAEGLSDAVTASAALARAATDDAGLTDSSSQSSSGIISYNLTDPEGLIDALTQTAAYQRAAADAEGLADTAQSQFAGARQASDALGLLDSLAQSTGTFRVVTDAENALDSLAFSVGTVRSLSELLGLTDAQSRLYGGVRIVSDQQGLADALGVVLGSYTILMVYRGPIDGWVETMLTRWNGTVWVPVTLQRWDGAAWVAV